jgi:exosome complex component RRP41
MKRKLKRRKIILKQKNEKLISKKGLRLDGRKIDELRSIKMDVGVLPNADGSAYVEHGKNKILVGVFGPREVHPKHLALQDRTRLRCRYHMAPFSVQERKSPAPSRREIELSKVIRESLEPSIFTERYPRTSIDVYIEVLQANGGTRCASITAASLALADTGIPMRDLVCACAAGKIEDKIVLDLSDVEDKKGLADVPVALMPNFNAITLLQMDGILSLKEFKKTVDMAIKGSLQIYKLQRETLTKKYISMEEVDN